MYDESSRPEREPQPLAAQPGVFPLDPFGWHVEQERLQVERAAQRRRMLRRLQLLLAVSLAAFCVVTVLLVRGDGSLMAWLGISGPSRVVRQHLEALSRGEARQAYSFFSKRYRAEIPLQGFEQLVNSHRQMFRTRVLSIETPVAGNDSDGNRAVLETRLASSTGNFYNARFTLIRAEGRWWIDQIRWSEAPNPASFTRT